MEIRIEFTDPIQVWVRPACGMLEMMIGFILELESPNPILVLPNGFGVRGTRKLLDLIDEIKSDLEKTDDGWVYQGGKKNNVTKSVE